MSNRRIVQANLEQFKIKKYGEPVTVPDNKMAQLMYYLSCVQMVVDFGIPSNLTNYSNYYKLKFEQENAVILFAELLDYRIFTKNKIMINDPDLCFGYSNQFYEISDSRTSVIATREFIIGGQVVHTLKIMAFKKCWIDENYIIPMSFYSARLQAIKNGTVEKFRPKPITYNTPSYNNYNYNHNDNCSHNYNYNHNDNYSHNYNYNHTDEILTQRKSKQPTSGRNSRLCTIC